MAARSSKRPDGGPRSLASIQVDVTTRLGAVAPTTTTGIGALDALLGGGLRSGTHLLVSGGPGAGKTSLVLMFAYMAARARTSVLFSSVGLDDTEIVARLTARALHREYRNVAATYGTLWSGQSMQDPSLRGPIVTCLDSMVKKVGDHFHLHSAEPMDDVGLLADHAAYLWARNERVVVVVDGAEGYSAGGETRPSGWDERLSLVGYELSRLASQGCAVVTTCQLPAAAVLAPTALVVAELRPTRDPSPRPPKKKLSIESRPTDLVIVKNRLGPTPIVPLVYHAAASVFEERNP